MGITKYETETIITYNDEEKTATVYTANKPLRKRLEKISQKHPEFALESETQYDVKYVIPKKYVKIQKPKEVSAETREKQRAAAKERFGKKEE